MDFEIVEYLRATFSPEMAATYEESFQLFSHFNVEDYILPFSEIYSLVDDFDSTYIQQQFVDQLDVSQRSLLNAHGIFMNDEATAQFMNDILEGLKSVDSYSDIAAILTILDTQNTDEEKFSDIFEHVTTQPADVILTNLNRVNPGLIRKIAEIYNERRQHLSELSNNETTVIKQKAAWVKQLYQSDNLIFKQCKQTALYPKLEEGLRFNMAYDFYFKMLWDEIDEFGNYDLARELVGMAIISSDASDKVLETLRDTLSANFSDIDQIGRITDIATQQFLVSKQDNGVSIGAPV